MIRGIYYYRFGCPYCWRFDKYVLEPLEAANLVSVRRINADLVRDSSALAINRWVADRVTTTAGTDIVTPLLVVYHGGRIGKVVFSIYGDVLELESKTVRDEVAIMARSFVNYLCKRLKIPKSWLLSEFPLVRIAVTGTK